MRKEVRFDHFEEGQTIYFNIKRLEELEKESGKTLGEILSSTMSLVIMTAALIVGLQHENGKRPAAHYRAMLDEYIEKGGALGDIWKDILKAILISGAFGKEAAQAVERQENAELQEDAEKNVTGAK